MESISAGNDDIESIEELPDTKRQSIEFSYSALKGKDPFASYWVNDESYKLALNREFQVERDLNLYTRDNYS